MNSQPRKLSAYADTSQLQPRRTVLRSHNFFVSAQADSFCGCEFIRLNTGKHNSDYLLRGARFARLAIFLGQPRRFIARRPAFDLHRQ